MVEWLRKNPWRQGHVLTEATAKLLNLANATTPEDTVIVIASHDCDLAQLPEDEPIIELLLGREIEESDGNYTFGKNPRILHLPFTGGTSNLKVEMLATAKITVKKQLLAGHEPCSTARLVEEEREVLQRWLAARYRRSAFPDEFEDRLKSTGLRDRLKKIFGKLGHDVVAVYIRVDDGGEHHRTEADDPYTVIIYLVFSVENDEEATRHVADAAKVKIETAFSDCCKNGNQWKDIELTECQVVSEAEFTLYEAGKLKRWQTDHISLKMDPLGPMAE